MEIKIGEYVRTKDGKIGKVIDISNITGQLRKKYLIKWNTSKAYYITNITIVKNGKNIIDLIEVNDIIVTKHPAFEKIYFEYIWSDEYLKRTKDSLNEKKLILLQILTHEQFEQNCYRLEESNV